MRVILAESQTLVRVGLRRLLEEQNAAQIVGEAADGQQLLELTGRLRPDAVITEINLPLLSGTEALTQIRRHYPEVAVLILSSLIDGQHVRSALRCGAAGFIAKDAEPVELGLALRAVQRRQIYLSPSISHLAVERRSDHRVEDSAELTPRQRQVLQLIARGKSTKEIASLMGVSIKTVETHRARLMQTLGLYGTNALMRHAIRLGLDYAQL
ncbi:two component transcriptional regulator, LuxR family [Solimonas aquatica]|uniref:Two component transcriptional regulator, LuxR family n=1 Tax=Solimonas aquatica TaxID=489703 RepID=A0A1H9HJ47_9GAMM|nr:response regulator transcription factor [Solimonas aquatica]SEQ62343.1 two component transcriptional regulator, LuxR family [Solimonas aquatica]